MALNLKVGVYHLLNVPLCFFNTPATDLCCGLQCVTVFVIVRPKSLQYAA